MRVLPVRPPNKMGGIIKSVAPCTSRVAIFTVAGTRVAIFTVAGTVSET
jgi:hypothetical protein